MLYLGPNGLVTNEQCAPIQCDECPDGGCGGDNCYTFDCPGGTDECPWDPPLGECASCGTGTTPNNVLVALGDLDLSTQLAGAQLAFWEAYFQSGTFELEQIGTCSYRYVDDQFNAEPFQTTSFEEIRYTLSLTAFADAWQLEIIGTQAGGAGPTLNLWAFYPATDNAGTVANYPGGDECDAQGVGFTQYYSQTNAAGWTLGDCVPLTLTMMPWGSSTADHA